jgi:hypothetical protein
VFSVTGPDGVTDSHAAKPGINFEPVLDKGGASKVLTYISFLSREDEEDPAVRSQGESARVSPMCNRPNNSKH